MLYCRRRSEQSAYGGLFGIYLYAVLLSRKWACRYLGRGFDLVPRKTDVGRGFDLVPRKTDGSEAIFMQFCRIGSFHFFHHPIASPPLPPKGRRPGTSDVSPLSGISGLLFDSTFLAPLLFFYLVLLLFLSCSLFLSPVSSTSPNLFQKILQHFF